MYKLMITNIGERICLQKNKEENFIYRDIK